MTVRTNLIIVFAALVVFAMVVISIFNRQSPVVEDIDATPDLEKPQIAEVRQDHDFETVSGETDPILGPEYSETQPIFRDVPDAKLYNDVLQEMIKARPVGEYRVVEFNSNQFREVVRNSQESPSFDVTLLGAGPTTLVAVAAGESHSGWQTGFGSWLGKVEGEDLSTAQFVVGPDGTLNGVIRSSELGRIKIEAVPDSPYHIIWSWDKDHYQQID